MVIYLDRQIKMQKERERERERERQGDAAGVVPNFTS
jgi:hypothetical protein